MIPRKKERLKRTRTRQAQLCKASILTASGQIRPNRAHFTSRRQYSLRFVVLAGIVFAIGSALLCGLIPSFQRGRTKVRSVPGLEDAIFALKIGAQWGPRRFSNSWWFVHCMDKTGERTIPYAEVAAECRTGALIAKATQINGRRVTAEFDEFKRHSLIQAFDPSYESVVRVR